MTKVVRNRGACLLASLALGLVFGPRALPAEPGPPGSPPPGTSAPWKNDWARGAVFYEIFVRSFADSNGDGIGDLPGLIGKLDYLNDGDSTTTNDLGIGAIWLMPVFRSPSYHGYDVTDYEHINPDYGTDADFERLLTEAHRRGIRVIVDYVMNHTSSEHPWFLDSASSPSSARRGWYVWSATDRGWFQPWGGRNRTWHPRGGAYYYGLFWGGMPDLNFRTPAVRAEMERIAAVWLGRGVDGFRLDATRHLIETGSGKGQNDTRETHAYLKEFAAAVRRIKPDAVLVGENWTDTRTIAPYYGSAASLPGGDELPMNFDFPLAEAILEGVNSGTASPIMKTLDLVKALYPPGAIDAPFLTNHDQKRLASQLRNDRGRMRNAAAILLTMPGAPFLYYGEEVGLENGPGPGDEPKRTPMPWDGSHGGGFTAGTPWHPFAPGLEKANVAAESRDPGSLLSRYRALIRARNGSAALRAGNIAVLASPTRAPSMLVFVRGAGDERVLVAHNLSDRATTGGPYDAHARTLERLFADDGVLDPSESSRGWSITLPARATAIWRLR